MLNVGDSLYWKTGIDNKGLQAGTTQAKGILAGFVRNISAMDIFAVLSAGAIYHFKKIMEESIKLAARFETLGVVMQTVGNTAGYSNEQMLEFQKGLEKTGITMIESRVNLIRMLQSELDLTKATELARVAQDAAVIANMDSSRTFETMIHGIQSGHTLILRNIGIMVNFEDAYNKAAKTLGRNADELSAVEQAQIRMNAVLEAGKNIAGTYEAAYGTVGKKLLSLKRPIEDVKVLLGQAFTPALADIVDDIMKGVTDLKTSLENNKDVIDDWGTGFRLVVIAIEAELIRMAMLIDKIGGSFTAFTGIMAAFPGMRILPGFTKETAENMAIANVEFENRYLAGLKALEDLAARVDEIMYEKTPEAKVRAQALKDAIETLKLQATEAAKTADAIADANQKRLEDQKSLEDELLKGQEEWRIKSQEYREQELADNQEFEEELFKEQEEWQIKSQELKEQEHEDNLKAEEEHNKKIEEAIEKSNRKRLQSIWELGNAFRSLGSLIGLFDTKLGKIVSDVSEITKALTQIKEPSTTGWGKISGILSIIETAYTMISTIMDSIMASEPYSKLGNKLKTITTELEKQQGLLDVTYGNERIEQLRKIQSLLEEQAKIEAQITKAHKDRLAIFMLERRDQTKELSTELIRIQEEIDRILTATMTESIADSIAAGLSQGLDFVQVFADTFEDLMKNALMEAFKRDIMTRYLSAFYEMFAIYGEGGLERWEIEDLKTMWETIQLGMEAKWKDLKLFTESMGFDLTGISKTKETGISGAIKGVSEGTAGLLAGQFNAMRMNTVEMLNISKLSLAELGNINAGKLEGIFNATLEIRDLAYYLDDIYQNTTNLEWIFNRQKEISGNSWYLPDIYKELGRIKDGNLNGILNASQEIRDNTYGINTLVSYSMRIAENTAFLRTISAQLASIERSQGFLRVTGGA